MQFVDISNGKKSKRISALTWEREKDKRYQGWSAGDHFASPDPKAPKTVAPNMVERKPFLPPAVQKLRDGLKAEPKHVEAPQVDEPTAPVGTPAGEEMAAEVAEVVDASGAVESAPLRRGNAKKFK